MDQIKDVYVLDDEIKRLKNQNQLLEDTGDNIRLTEKGIDVSNYVMSEFLF